MKDKKFIGWFSDVGFTCRVLIICETLHEWADTWGAPESSTFVQALMEVEETALMEMERYEALGVAGGYFGPGRTLEEEEGEDHSSNVVPD